MQTLIKRPAEVRVYTWDFSLLPEIAGTDTLTGTPVCTATLFGTGSPTAPTIGTPAIASGSKKVTAQVSAGDDGYSWRMQCVCGTAAGLTLAVEGRLQVSSTAAPPGG